MSSDPRRPIRGINTLLVIFASLHSAIVQANINSSVAETEQHALVTIPPRTNLAMLTWYFDNDGDGYGDPNILVIDSVAPPNYVSNNSDCNDNDSNIHPGVTEICNGIDDDCSGVIDDNIPDEVDLMWAKTFGGSDDENAFAMDVSSDGGYVVGGNSNSSDGNLTQNLGKTDAWIIKVSAGGNLIWQKNYGGSGDEAIQALRKTPDGGYVFAASTSSLNGNVSGNHGSVDFWIVKLDSAGNLLWQKCYGGTSADIPYAMDLTTDGGYIVAGTTYSNNGNVTAQHGAGDYWVIKLDGNGTLQWQKTFGGSAFDFAHAVVQSRDGGFLVSGYARSNDGDVLLNHGQEDMWILKLDQSGNIVWQKSYGGTGGEGANSAVQTSDGGYVLAGTTHSYNVDVVGNHGIHDFWVVKIDSLGNLLWKECLGGSQDDNGNCIRQTQDGGFIVTGLSNSNDGDVSGNHGDHDFWVVKLASNGAIQWQQSFGGSDDDVPYSVVQDAQGAYAVSGYTDSGNDDVNGNNGEEDFWIIKISAPVQTTYYQDADGDSYGNPNVLVTACSTPPGYVTDFTDCNDADPNIHPGAADVCNNIDDNCNGYTDEGGITAAITPLATITLCTTSTLTLQCTTTAPNYSYQWLKDGNNLMGATNSSYNVTLAGVYWIVVSNGTCSANSPSTIIKLANPNLNINPAGTIKVCAGTSVTFSTKESPGIAYQWKNSNGTISGATNLTYSTNAPGNYYLAETDITGCSFSSPSSHLQNYSAPTVTITVTGSLNICYSGSVILNASVGTGYAYQWYKDNAALLGATNSFYTATIVGSYKVLVTSSNGCTKYSSIKTVKGCKESSEDSGTNSSLVVYPNPTQGTFTYKWQSSKSFSGKAQVSVYNGLGQVVLAKEIEADNGTATGTIILPEDIESGLYYLRISTQEDNFISSITVLK